MSHRRRRSADETSARRIMARRRPHPESSLPVFFPPCLPSRQGDEWTGAVSSTQGSTGSARSSSVTWCGRMAREASFARTEPRPG